MADGRQRPGAHDDDRWAGGAVSAWPAVPGDVDRRRPTRDGVSRRPIARRLADRFAGGRPVSRRPNADPLRGAARAGDRGLHEARRLRRELSGAGPRDEPVTSARELTLFLQSLGQALAAAADVTHDAAVAAGIRRLADLSRSISPVSTARSERRSTPLPVCRFWVDAIAAASRAGSSLAGVVDRLAPHLSWTQNPNYRREPPDPGFLDRYGYAVIVGPEDGPPALAVA